MHRRTSLKRRVEEGPVDRLKQVWGCKGLLSRARKLLSNCLLDSSARFAASLSTTVGACHAPCAARGPRGSREPLRSSLSPCALAVRSLCALCAPSLSIMCGALSPHLYLCPLSLHLSESLSPPLRVSLSFLTGFISDAHPGVGGHFSRSLPNAYATLTSRRQSRFRTNPSLCHTTARYLPLQRESPNVGQNRTARLQPGVNMCSSPPGWSLPHCLCQSSARTRGGC